MVIPFNKFHGSDPLVGPEMRSTGEVMGVGKTFEEAYAKANLGAGVSVPKSGRALDFCTSTVIKSVWLSLAKSIG